MSTAPAPNGESIKDEETLPRTPLVELGFWGGDYIGEAEIETITVQEPTIALLFVGLKGSGKTTLIASLYEHFQLGPYGGYEFAGSRTFVGLERLSFLARADSEGDREDTERTDFTNDVRFMHMRVRQQAESRQLNSILISDVQGEVFKQAADSVEDCENLKIARRADSFVFLLDGNQIITPSERHVAFDTTLMILQRFIDAGFITNSSRVDFLFTKNDLIEASESADEAAAYIDDRTGYIRQKFGAKIGRLSFRRVAARPLDGGYENSVGIEDLFGHWLRLPPRSEEQWCVTESPNVGSFGERLPWINNDRL